MLQHGENSFLAIIHIKQRLVNECMKPIEHVVISGGGHNIITMCGAISYLQREKYLDFANLKSVDGTSAGSLLGFTFLLGMDGEELENYLLNRPWEKVFDLTPEVMFQTFQGKGLFDIHTMEEILRPIIKSCGVEETLTLQELYERTNTDFYIYATELNKLKMVTLSHHTHPNMRVIDAVYQSCAVPPLFKPIICDENAECLLDGGVFANYPLHCFFDRMPEDVDKETVFGIKLKHEQIEKDNIGDKSNITEYIFSLIRKLIQHIVIHREYDVQIPNELLIYSKGMSFETLKQSIHSRSEREHLMSEGRRYASVYLIYKQKSLN